MNNAMLRMIGVLFLLGTLGLLSLYGFAWSRPEATALAPFMLYPSGTGLGIDSVLPITYFLLCFLLGVVVYDQVRLRAPLLSHWVGATHTKPDWTWRKAFLTSVQWGVVIGLSMAAWQYLMAKKLAPEDFATWQQHAQAPWWVKLLYKSITEEIMARFGIMAGGTWILFQLLGRPTQRVYWTANIAAGFFFTMMHLPALYQIFDQPPVLMVVYLTVLYWGTGIAYGYLYWKKGLETALATHLVGNLILLLLPV